MELSIFDLSKQLGVTTSTIERWLRQGTLPVSRKGAKIKIQVKELEKWASKHNLVLNLTEEQPAEKKEILPISLSSAIQDGGIYTGIEGNNTESVLKDAIKKIVGIPPEFKPDVLTRLMEREGALSTGIGNGIAIPHPREQVSFLDVPIVSVCFLAAPVDYHALDNKPVSVLFIILCPELRMHLQLLSALSFCLKNQTFIRFLNSQPDSLKLVEQIDFILKENPLL